MMFRLISIARVAIIAIDSHKRPQMGTYSLTQAMGQLSRLVDEALTGEPVIITRHGKPVVTLAPTQPAPKPLTGEYLKEMRGRARARPSLGSDSVTLVREMRDEER